MTVAMLSEQRKNPGPDTELVTSENLSENLAENIAKVSVPDPCHVFYYVTTLILTWTVQLAPDCDLVPVRDDDLERNLRVGDRTVSKDNI